MATTLRAIFSPDRPSQRFSHESMWPLCGFHYNYSIVGKWLEAPPPGFAALLDKPILVHWGGRNPTLNPLTTDGPGRAQWGVAKSDVQQEQFWQDHSSGPHGWRIIGSAKLFSLCGDLEARALGRLIHTSNEMYESRVQPGSASPSSRRLRTVARRVEMLTTLCARESVASGEKISSPSKRVS